MHPTVTSIALLCAIASAQAQQWSTGDTHVQYDSYLKVMRIKIEDLVNKLSFSLKS